MQPDQIRKLGRIAAVGYVGWVALSVLGAVTNYLTVRVGQPEWEVLARWGIYYNAAFGVLMLRAAYLGWFRWSPLAVRHILSWPFAVVLIALVALSFWVLMRMIHLPDTIKLMVVPLPLIAIIFSYWLYRRTSRWVSERAFPAS